MSTPDTLPRTLEQWLAHCERTHVKPIDMGLERAAAVWSRLGLRFEAPVFTVAGTNGKGSTCAMLECIARRAGYRTALYTSPHLVRFEERCCVDGEPLPASALLPHFEAVEAARQGSPLSWFEFTTLAIFGALIESRPDVVILEVGLGGRLDAVNIIDADCAVIATIDLDHMEYLGNDRESIGREKAHIMRGGRPAVVSDPRPPASLLEHASRIGADLWLAGRDYKTTSDRQQWSWSGRSRRYSGLAHPALRGANQVPNAAGVLAAFEALGDRLPISAQAVREGLATVQLPGRFQVMPGRPAIVLDVAHNDQAVANLAVNLDAMGFFPRTHAVFGAMADKAVAAMVARLVPLVGTWYCTALPTPRAAPARDLANAVRAAAPRAQISTHADPTSALRAAQAAADPADRILVFGSFFTVGGVLEHGFAPPETPPPGAPPGG